MERPCHEKLDRVLCNVIWRNSYPKAHVKVLHRLEFSDHHPLLLTLVDKDLRKVPKSFKFECSWLIEDSFDHLLKTS